jgi:hypothetical protein
MEFSPGESMGSIYLSNLDMTPSNLEVVPVAPVAPLGSPEITGSLSIVALLPRPSLGESLSRSCESWGSPPSPIGSSPHSLTA